MKCTGSPLYSLLPRVQESTVHVVPAQIYVTSCTGTDIWYILYRGSDIRYVLYWLGYTVNVVPARIYGTVVPDQIYGTCCTGSD